MKPSIGNERRDREVLLTEFGAAILLTLSAVCFHWSLLHNAGGLWRDEASFVRLATLPHWQNLWQGLTHDHCPILAPALLRCWSALGQGRTDFSLRIWGMASGLLLLASLWVASWTMRRGIPILPLVLLGLNVTVIRYGDSLRAYGLGSALGVLMLTMVWRAAAKTSRVNLVLAALAALLSVQALYQNAAFVLGACSAGMAVCALEKRWRDALAILAVGLVAAASLLPYIKPIIDSQSWWILEKAGFTAEKCWKNVSTAADSSLPGFIWLWITLCLLAAGVAIHAVRKAERPAYPGPALYGAIALVVGFCGFIILIKISNLPTQPWYYIPLLAFIAPCLDVVLSSSDIRARATLIVLAAVVVILSWGLAWPETMVRSTNADIVAARLQADADPGDCIVINPWYVGVSFSRYYQGTAPWFTLPPLGDYTLHRYDLVKIKMQEEHPLEPVLAKIADTLRSGHRVWFVGDIVRTDHPPADLRPAPFGPPGWFDFPYYVHWSAQVSYLLSTRVSQVDTLSPLTPDRVNPIEDLSLYVFSGWQTNSAPDQ